MVQKKLLKMKMMVMNEKLDLDDTIHMITNTIRATITTVETRCKSISIDAIGTENEKVII